MEIETTPSVELLRLPGWRAGPWHGGVGKRGRGDGGVAVGAASPCASRLPLGSSCHPAPAAKNSRMESHIPPTQGASGIPDATGARHCGEKARCAAPTDIGTPFTTELRVSTLEKAQQATVCSTPLQRRCFQAFTAVAADCPQRMSLGPQHRCPNLGTSLPCTAPGRCPGETKLRREPGNAPKPPPAASSPLFQGSDAGPLCIQEARFGIAGLPRSSAERDGLPLNTDQSMTG